MAEELDELVVPDAAALRAWLQAHHDTSRGVWLALGRKGGSTTTLTRQQTATPNRYALLHRLMSVKKAETRQRRIEQLVQMLARHETPDPQKATPTA